jgi:hypothetical protein
MLAALATTYISIRRPFDLLDVRVGKLMMSCAPQNRFAVFVAWDQRFINKRVSGNVRECGIRRGTPASPL